MKQARSRRRQGDAGKFLLHLHPPQIPSAAIKFFRSWGLGGMALVLFGLLVLSGVLSMLVYQPISADAYHSIQTLQEVVPFGGWVRSIHYWSANGIVAVTVLHLLRVFFTGGFTGLRRSNWWIGLGLLACILVAAFTGYLLPWDQLAYWAITICTSMLAYVPVIGGWLQEIVRGGAGVGAGTLGNFFTLHTSIVPAVLVILMGFHFWKVRKAGGIVLPVAASASTDVSKDNVSAYPNLVVREAALALALVALVLLVAVFSAAPLGPAANPGMSPNPAKAPWYFLGEQELLIHLQPMFAAVFIPCLAVAGLMLLPYVPLSATEVGIWFRSRDGARSSVVAAVLALVCVPIGLLVDNSWYHGGAALAGVPPWLSGGVLPVVVSGTLGTASVFWMRRRHGRSPAEVTQAIFVFLLVAFSLLTVTGLWFRGPGMALVLPGSAAP